MIKLQRCTHKLYIHTNYVILALLCIVANYIREVSFLTHDIALIFKDDWFIRLEGDGLCTLLLQLLDCTTRQKYNDHNSYTAIRLGC